MISYNRRGSNLASYYWSCFGANNSTADRVLTLDTSIPAFVLLATAATVAIGGSVEGLVSADLPLPLHQPARHPADQAAAATGIASGAAESLQAVLL